MWKNPTSKSLYRGEANDLNLLIKYAFSHREGNLCTSESKGSKDAWEIHLDTCI